MAFIEELELSGKWLFRFRSYIPLIMIVLYLFTITRYEITFWILDNFLFWELFCFAISFFGLWIRIITIGFIPKGTSGRNTTNQVAETLNITGIYSVVRNPLYLGNYFMGLGLFLLFPLWWMVLIYTMFFWIYYERIIFTEEVFLRNKFKEQFLVWAKETPLILPKFKNYKKAGMSFSLRNVLKREYNGFFAIIITFIFVKTFRFYIHTDNLKIDLWELILLGVSFILWISLRSLKKYTNLLKVEGR